MIALKRRWAGVLADLRIAFNGIAEKRGRTRACWVVSSMLLAGSLLVVITVLPRGAMAMTLYVGGSGPGNYTTIQGAIDSANPGDTVFVYGNTYNERILIAKTLSLVGEDRNLTIIDGQGSTTLVEISADYVNITGFTLANVNSTGGTEISVRLADHVRIENNTFSGCSYRSYDIKLYSSSNTTISNNLFTGLGIVDLTLSSYNTISDNSASGDGSGIEVISFLSDYNTFIHNTLLYTGTINVHFSANNIIADNTFDYRGDVVVCSIYLDSTTNSVVANNSIIAKEPFTYSASGIQVAYSSNTSIIGNRIIGDTAGIWLIYDDGVFIDNNTMVETGIVIDSTLMEQWMNTTISTSNTVNGKPVYYWKNAVGGTIPPGAGEVILANSTGVTVADQNLSYTSHGIHIGFSSNNTFSNLSFSRISFSAASFYDSHNNTIANSSFYSNAAGLGFHQSNGNIVINSTFSMNIGGSLVIGFSENNTVRDCDISMSTRGVGIFEGNNTLVTDNTIWQNWISLQLSSSSNAVVTGNTFLDNVDGVNLTSSSGNSIYHNNFLGNLNQASDDGSNTWDDGYPSGGNHWSDYNGSDNYSGPSQDIPGSDGIGDMPYNISGGIGKDRYPFMDPIGPPPWRPTAPTSLQATDGVNQVGLSWTTPTSDGGAPITDYVIYRGDSPDNVTYYAETAAVLSYIDSGLTNHTTYYYRVAAKNSVGMGPRSNVANAMPITGPGMPTGLTASPGDGQVMLTWSAPSNDGGSPITNYRISRGLTSGNESFLVEIGNVLSYTDSGLTNGQRYFYLVAARNSAGVGPNSTEVSATPANVPSSPLNLQGSPGDGQVILTWLAPASDGGSPITNYLVFRGLTSSPKVLLVEIGDVLNYTDAAVTNGQTYYYEVSAKNAIGEGTKSNEVVATPGRPPSPPRNLTAVRGNTEITLTWLPPTDDGGSAITSYRVYRGPTPGGETLLVEVSNVTIYFDVGLANGRTYCYEVSALNAIGESGRSNEVCTTPATIPDRPVGFTAAGGNGKVDLAWSPPANDGGSPVAGYMIYRGTSPGGENLLVSLGNVLSYTDSNVANGVTYYYTAAALNDVGQGVNSTEVSAKPVGPPSEPLGLEATAGDHAVTLSWNPPATDGGLPVTNYVIYRGDSPGVEAFLIEIGNVMTYADEGLSNGVTYYYRVTSKNVFGESGMSTEVSAKPVATPGPPISVTALASFGRVVLNWSPPSDDGGSSIVGYAIYRGTAPGGETLLTHVGNTTTFVDTNVTIDQTYYYMLRAKNALGEGSPSTEVSATPTAKPPVAVARGRNHTQVGEAVTFDGTESEGNITEYAWTIRDGDGRLVTSMQGSVVSYAFQKTGRYVVTLQVTDASTGLTSEDSFEIVVTEDIVVGEGFNMWLLVLLAAALIATSLIVRTEAVRVTLLTLLVAPAYGKKLKGKEEPETRGLVRGYILGNPGGCYTDIKKALALNDGSVAWHLMKLVKEGVVKSKVQGTKKRYYPARMSLPDDGTGELLEIQKLLLGAAGKDPGSTVKLLADEVGVSRQLALYHLRKLQRDGRVSFEKKGLRMRVYLASGSGTKRPA